MTTGVLAATLVLASCGNGGGGATVDEPVSTEGTDTAGSGAEQTVRPCIVFTLEEAEAMAGSPITDGPSSYGGTSGCQWTSEVVTEDDGRESRMVDLQLHDVAVTLEEVLTLDGEPTPVDGLGEQALVEVSATGRPAVMAGYRDADRVVTLLYEVQGAGASTVDPRDDPNKVVDALRTLADRIAQPPG